MKITVVTALLNSDPAIQRTADSLLPQLVPGEIEWFIKDSSSDQAYPGSLAAHPGVTYYSERDRGVYHGMNQALERVNSDFIVMNGAGDAFLPGALAHVRHRILLNTKERIFFFSIYYGTDKTRVIRPMPRELSKRMAVPNPAAFLHFKTVKDLGGYDTSYKIAADYDLLCRMILKVGRCFAEDYVVTDFVEGGLSERRRSESVHEKALIQLRNFP